VSPPAAAVWLAEIGIFVKSEPALSPKVVRAAIERNDSLAVIAAEHGWCANTVVVEMHRHGLFTEHRQRHLS
jgi:hypothetical protein